MRCSGKSDAAFQFFMLVAILFLASAPPSQAQVFPGYPPALVPDTPRGASSRYLSLPGRYLETVMPGLADPSQRLFFLPAFRAELKIRCLYEFMSGEWEQISTGHRVDLDDELGFVDTTVIVQPALRMQFGRLSLRFYGDMYTRELKSPAGSTIYWPTIWFGADYDVIERDAWRAGLTFDVTPIYPEFTIAPNPVGAVHFEAVRPATLGLFFLYKPRDMGGLTPSIEVRARRGVRTGSRMNEAELAVGIKTPETVLGTMALRGGWRYTTIECHDERDHVIRPTFSAYFLELVHYY